MEVSNVILAILAILGTIVGVIIGSATQYIISRQSLSLEVKKNKVDYLQNNLIGIGA